MSRNVRREARILLAHPWGWIACGLGSGLSPVASGTTGSAAAVAIYWIAGADAWPLWLHALLLITGFGVGVLASSWACKSLDTDDAAPIVIDEWVGQWLTLCVGPLLWPPQVHQGWMLLAGFLLFRLSDIVKPWPASTLDRDLGGGLGAMADDAVAGVYSALTLAALGWILGWAGV
jgi:phosphatidylglycerophosphatase A